MLLGLALDIRKQKITSGQLQLDLAPTAVALLEHSIKEKRELFPVQFPMEKKIDKEFFVGEF